MEDEKNTITKKDPASKRSNTEGTQKSSNKKASLKSEFKKIIWPNKQELRKQTITVIVTSIIIGAIIFGMDSGYTGLQSLVLRLIGS